MALVTTPGAANADSYATLVEASDYIATLTYATDWPATDPAREKVLKQAALVMETLKFKGSRVKSAEEQALSFPRNGLCDVDGWAIAITVVPIAVKRAQIALALELAKKDRTVDAGPLVPDRLVAGKTTIEGLRRHTFPDHVLALLRPFLASSGISVPLVRG
jgi:hypothetical protein